MKQPMWNLTNVLVFFYSELNARFVGKKISRPDERLRSHDADAVAPIPPPRHFTHHRGLFHTVIFTILLCFSAL